MPGPGRPAPPCRAATVEEPAIADQNKAVGYPSDAADLRFVIESTQEITESGCDLTSRWASTSRDQAPRDCAGPAVTETEHAAACFPVYRRCPAGIVGHLRQGGETVARDHRSHLGGAAKKGLGATVRRRR